ncbi:MAG TPA: topoisomerase DNA-binding C4 zinc finger domain-containing protein [Thermoanaerobaculia bacterium]
MASLLRSSRQYTVPRSFAIIPEVIQGGYEIARVAERSRQRDPTDPTDRTDNAATPACPACGKGMVLRTARTGALAGTRFWGCVAYPRCTGARPLA